MEMLSQPRTRQPFVLADFDALLAQLRSKHVVTESGKIAAVRSTVGLVVDGTTVSMVVPGGPAYKAVNGKRIEKGDRVIGIDPDGSGGIKQADEASVIGLLRGADVVGSSWRHFRLAPSASPRLLLTIGKAVLARLRRPNTSRR